MMEGVCNYKRRWKIIREGAKLQEKVQNYKRRCKIIREGEQL